jgi:membrane protein DedA with SNARE-associated domain
MIEQTIITLNNLPNETIYFFLFFIAFIEYVLPPVPGDTLMVFGAYLAGTGKLDILAVYILTTLGSIIGFLILFFIGKYYGRKFFLKKNYRFFPKELILQIEKWFQRYGFGLIAANRFLSGARSAVSLFAGMSNTNVYSTTLAALVSSMIWNALLLSGGYFLGKNWQLVVTIVMRYNQLIFILFILLLLFYFWKKKKNNAGTS